MLWLLGDGSNTQGATMEKAYTAPRLERRERIGLWSLGTPKGRREDGTVPFQLPLWGPSLSFPTESVYPWSPGVTEGTAYTMDVQGTLSLGPSYGFPNPLVGGSSGQTSG